MTTPSPEFLTLQRVVAGRYSLVRELGRGGMGIVFLARDVTLERLVAIKLLPPALAVRAALRDRFVREARTAAGLSHPHIVPVHSVEQHEELVFFVMAYVEGETLAERIQRSGPLGSAEAMRVVQEVAWALAHAHAHGVVHRDVKAENILLERGTDRSLVVDFGISAIERDGVMATRETTGTPRYMSPEQARGEPTDPRSDLYSLGVMAWFAVTGRFPFDGAPNALMVAHAEAPLPALRSVLPRGSRLPARFAATIEQALAKAPTDRFASADAMAAEIDVARLGTVAAPPAVRNFVRNAESAGGEIGTALTAAFASNVVLWTVFPDDPFAGPVFYTASALAAGLAAIRLGQVVIQARQLLMDGFRFAQVRQAILREAASQAELAPKKRRRIRAATWLLAGWAVIKTSAMIVVSQLSGPMWMNILGAAGMVIVPTFSLRMLWDDLLAGHGLWLRALAGRLGRAVFRMAGWLVRRREQVRLVSDEHPTMTFVALDARDRFDALPPEVRRRVAGVPALLERLRASAEQLREREDPVSRERFATIATALEGVRLDLLRLGTGASDLAAITADLELAEAVGAQVDDALRAELRTPQSLRTPTPNPTN